MAIADHPTTYPLEPMKNVPADLRVSLDRVAALYRINEAMTQAASELHAMQVAAEGLVYQAGYLSSWITVVDHATSMLRGRAGIGPGIRDEAINAEIPLNAPTAVTQVVHSGDAVVIYDAIAHADREGWGDVAREIEMKSVIYVPFGTSSEVLGVIAVGTPQTMQTEEELTLLGLFGTQLVTALAKLKYDVERAHQIRALEAAAVAQQRLLDTVRELSTPAIPIYDGILALPLVGNIDTGRASQIMETVLSTIAREHASVVILDVTGVPIIDTGVANHLVQVTQAAQLLGARAMLVGIKPEVAQTLVQLGVDLSSIITRSNLQAGVAYALMQRGLQIVEARP